MEIQFNSTVDDILFDQPSQMSGGTSNMKEKMKHKSKNTADKFQPVTGCLSNKWGKCKARFLVRH